MSVSLHEMLDKRLVGLLVVVLVAAVSCSDGSGSSSSPPVMNAVNQSNGVQTEIEADSWCVDALFSVNCATVDQPVTEVVAECDDNIALGLPDGLVPAAGDELEPVTNDEAWLVTAPEGTVVVFAEGSGRWSRASWTFELTREGAC